MSATTQGISFLYSFDFGNRDVNNPGANILSVTDTAAGDFDKANLTTEPLRQVWRSANASGWKEIVIEAEVSSQIDTVALLGHNLTEDAVVQVQGDFSDAFLAPAETKTMVWSKGNMAIAESFDAAYSHYRIRILDPSNPCGYVQVGRIVGGRAFTFDYNEDISDDFEIAQDDLADSVKSEGFFRISNDRVKVKSLSARFQKISTVSGQNANYLGWIEMMEEVGITKPFLTILDRGDPGFGLFWAQLDKIPGIGYTINRFASWNFKITEVF